jgi:hypothetical protein
MATPARFTNGVTNVAQNSLTRYMPVLDPTKVHMWFNDFDKYDAADWTVTTTEAGAGDATEALADADGGVLVITNDAADNDLDFLQKKGESFKFVAGKKLWYKCRFKILEVLQCDAHIGLTITDTTLLDVTDGVYFKTDDGDAYLDFGVEKDNTATAATAIATLVANTFVEVGFYYNGVDGIEYSVDGVVKGTAAVTNLPDDEELTVTFGIQNGEAVANVLSIDYIMVCKER